MKKFAFGLFALTAVALVSCNKDQSAVKKLDGKWLLEKVDDTEISFDDAPVVTYDACKLKKDEWCTATTTYPNDSTSTQEYKVIEDGTVIVTREPGSTFELESTITTLDKENLVLTTTVFGVTTVTEYAKK